MIKPSFIFVLFGVLVMMALAFLLYKGDRPDIKPPKDGELLIKAPFDITAAESITIKKGDVAITLEQKDKKWTMTSHKNRPAKLERVNMLLSDVNMAKVEGSRTGTDLAAYGLDDQGRTVVTVDRGSAKTELILGKTYEPLHAFARSDTGVIVEINKSLDTDAGVRQENDKRVLDPSYFYDLTVLAINSDDLIDVAIKKGHDVIRLQKVIPGKGPLQPKQEPGKDDPRPVWWITEPDAGAVDDASIARLIAQTHFPAKAYADTVPEKDRGFDKPAAKVEFRVKDGAEYSIIFGKVDPAEVFVQVEGRPDPYKIEKYIFDALTQDVGELKKKETGEAGPRPEGMPPMPPMPPGVGNPQHPAQRPVGPHEMTPDMIKRIPPPPVIVPPVVPPPPSEQKPALPPAVVRQPEVKDNKDAPKDEKDKPEEKK